MSRSTSRMLPDWTRPLLTAIPEPNDTLGGVKPLKKLPLIWTLGFCNPRGDADGVTDEIVASAKAFVTGMRHRMIAPTKTADALRAMRCFITRVLRLA